MPVCEQDFEDGVLKQTRIHLLGARGIEGIITVPSNGAPTLNWLLYDGHGNMVRTMNTAFALSGFQWRGVWGERTNSTPSRGYCANLGHPEDETGLVYMRARYYEPTTGRFISEDPARDGVNWFLYADGDPVGKVDADGELPLAISVALMFALYSVVSFFWNANSPITKTAKMLIESTIATLGLLDAISLVASLDPRQRATGGAILSAFVCTGAMFVTTYLAAYQLALLIFLATDGDYTLPDGSHLSDTGGDAWRSVSFFHKWGQE